jgi:hypothetical protein
MISFCPNCRQPCASQQPCPTCQVICDAEPVTYTEKLLTAIFSPDPTRVGMAIDVLTERLHDQRALNPLLILLQSPVDAHRLVMAARGLGRLGNQAAVPVLIYLLQDTEKPFVARISAAQALGRLGGKMARDALQQAISDERPSVADAARRALSLIVGDQ